MKTWEAGAAVALRGIFNQKPWFVESVRVVHDNPQEVALLLLPGSECAAPPGYIHKKHGDHIPWEPWPDLLENNWNLEKYHWNTNRFLILLEPEKFFATYYIWNHGTGQFQTYYINFQLPFSRSPVGFDSLDLELDIVIQPDYSWQWKDEDEYQQGIRSGIISPDHIRGIDLAQKDVFNRLENRIHPLNRHRLNWIPDPSWTPTQLPAGWDAV